MKIAWALLCAVLAVTVRGETCPGDTIAECTGSNAHMTCNNPAFSVDCVHGICTCSPISGGTTVPPGTGPASCSTDADCAALHPGGCPGSLHWTCLGNPGHHTGCHCTHAHG